MSLLLSLFLVTLPIVSNGFPWFHKPTINCGVRYYNNELIEGVIGVHDAEPGEMPFHVLLKAIDKPFYKCSGVLISNRWVLTSADCVTIFPDLRIVFKKRWFNEKIVVEGIYVHPRFNMTSTENNIALLLLREPVKFNEYIQPICLPEPGEDETFYGLNGTVAGYGMPDLMFETEAGWKSQDSTSKLLYLLRSYILPPVLKIITLPIIRNDICRKSYPETRFNYRSDNYVHISESVLCAGGPQPVEFIDGSEIIHRVEEGECGGYASPLMVNTGGHWVLAGIYLGALDCNSPEYPGTYTRVSYFLDWIKDTIHEETSNASKGL